MNQTEVWRVSEARLRMRLKEIASDSPEADMIRRELSRRYGGAA